MRLAKVFIFCAVAAFTAIVLSPIFFMFIVPHTIKGPIQEAIFTHRHFPLAFNSLFLSMGTTALALAIGVPFAFFISRTNLFGQSFFKLTYLIPLLIPPFIHAIVWDSLSGTIANLFQLPIHNLCGALFVLSLAYFPFISLMTLSGLKSIDKNLEEASLSCNGDLKTITKITFPLSAHHIFSGALFVFIFSIIDFGVPDIFRVRVYPIEIFIQFSALYNERAAVMLAIPLISLTLILVMFQRWIMKGRSYVNLGAGKGGKVSYDLGKYNPLAFLFCSAVMTFSVFIPLGVLVKKAGAFSNYLKAFTTSSNQFGYSLMLAFLGGLITLFLAFPLSYIIERSENLSAKVLDFASLIPFAVPGAILGIGLIRVWNRPLLNIVYKSCIIIVLGYIAHVIPFTIRVVCSGIKQINPHLEEAALSSTGNWAKITKKILIPLSAPSLMAGFFIGFVLSLGELGTPLLIIPAGIETIPMKIYNLMHYGAYQTVAALCLILIMITFLFSVALYVLYAKCCSQRHRLTIL